MAQRSLFPVIGDAFAKSYFYEADFPSPAEETDLVEQIGVALLDHFPDPAPQRGARREARGA